MIDSVSTEVKYGFEHGHDEILNELEGFSHDLKENESKLNRKLKNLESLSSRSEALRQKEDNISRKFNNMRSQLDTLLNTFQIKEYSGNEEATNKVQRVRDSTSRDSFYKRQTIEETYNSLTSGRIKGDENTPFEIIDKELYDLKNQSNVHPAYLDDFNDILHSLKELYQIIPNNPANIENMSELALSVKNTIETFTN